MVRYLLFLFGVILALPILAVLALAPGLPITLSGIGYLAGCMLTIAGLILAPWTGRHSSALVIGGLCLVISVASIRSIFVGQANIQMISLSGGNKTLWINNLVDEQDSLIFGEALFHWIGGDSAREHEGITSALHAAYSEMRQEQKVFSSPFAGTYLQLQRPARFDAVVLEPETNHPAEFAVVFLHGYMGNVTAQCWEIARAVRKFGAVTICPSTGWTGEWWRPQGQAILQSTFEYVRSRGIQKFYLGGFSNGGFSMSRLASQLGKENGLHGLFFINGIQNGTSIRETGLPVLILQSTQDERVPVTETRRIVGTIGSSGTYVELDGDHFIIMKQPSLVQNAIVKWLERFEAGD
ncbi:MAG TPA: alpha/beta hydrolase [Anaerolineales bacterium]|nr:alpha/beta hydrolase [Anaerolineales bacterium]